MKQTFSIRKINGQWFIFDTTDPLDIPFDDGGLEGFTKEECIQTCVNLNSVAESDEEEEDRENFTREFFSVIPPVLLDPAKSEEISLELLTAKIIEEELVGV